MSDSNQAVHSCGAAVELLLLPMDALRMCALYLFIISSTP